MRRETFRKVKFGPPRLCVSQPSQEGEQCSGVHDPNRENRGCDCRRDR